MPKCIGQHSKRVFPYSWSILSFFPTRCYLKSSLSGPWKPLRPIEYPGTTSGPKPCKNSTGREFNASNHQGGPQGWLRWIITRSIIFKSFSDMIFKSSHFPIEIPIKNENLSPNAILLSITLKFFLWPPLTQSHGWLRERSSIKKKVYCGTP